MLVRDILEQDEFGNTVRQALKMDCSTFIRESHGLPLYRSLPSTYDDLHRVKVRLQKRKDGVSDVFERAFGHTFANIRQRAVFASTSASYVNEELEPFYVFPTDGYRFLYSKEVTNSDADYRNVIDTLVSELGDLNEATDIVTDLLKYTYSTSALYEGMVAGAEVIFYGIPYYYAIRAAVYEDYNDLISTITI